MKKCYLGVDIGSISTKGVIIDEKERIVLYKTEPYAMMYRCMRFCFLGKWLTKDQKSDKI